MKARRNIHSRPKSIAAKNIKNDRVFHFRGHDEKAKNIKNRRVHDCGRHDPWATVGSQSFPVCWIVSLRIHSNMSCQRHTCDVDFFSSCNFDEPFHFIILPRHYQYLVFLSYIKHVVPSMQVNKCQLSAWKKDF